MGDLASVAQAQETYRLIKQRHVTQKDGLRVVVLALLNKSFVAAFGAPETVLVHSGFTEGKGLERGCAMSKHRASFNADRNL